MRREQSSYEDSVIDSQLIQDSVDVPANNDWYGLQPIGFNKDKQFSFLWRVALTLWVPSFLAVVITFIQEYFFLNTSFIFRNYKDFQNPVVIVFLIVWFLQIVLTLVFAKIFRIYSLLLYFFFWILQFLHLIFWLEMTNQKPEYLPEWLNVFWGPLLVISIWMSFILLTAFLIVILIKKNEFWVTFGLLFAYILYIPYIIFFLEDDPSPLTNLWYVLHFFIIIGVLFYFKYEVDFMMNKFNDKYFVEYWANGTFDFIFDFFGYFWYAAIFVKYKNQNEIIIWREQQTQNVIIPQVNQGRRNPENERSDEFY